MTTATTCLFFLALASQAPEGSDWETTTSERGGFSAAFPVKPTERVLTTTSPKGPLAIVVLVAHDGDTIYLAQRIQNPEPVRRGTEKALLDLDRDAFAASRKGKAVGEKRISLGGHPGREFTVEGKREAPDGKEEDATVEVRYYLTKSFSYNISASSPRGKAPEADVRRFFESFRLTETGDRSPGPTKSR